MSEGSAALCGKRIWLIDRREHWREQAARTLRAAGAQVAATDRYVDRAAQAASPRRPDLVVLLCTAVTSAELGLVREVHAQGDDVLVLVASLSPQAMRELFLAGAMDVTEMPVGSREVVELVAGTLRSSEAAREHRATALAGP